jgi:acyl-CoA reductase-like NAD-dependent aldehyde dehydrogenase
MNTSQPTFESQNLAYPIVNEAVNAASAAFSVWQSSNGALRARLLESLAKSLEENCEELVILADSETHLGTGRLVGELNRTTYQLRRFADLAHNGTPFSQFVDPIVSAPPPVGHPLMVRQLIPLGPVAMFSASNFPFAFSVLGGDTASAIAAGCPVVVKAHSGHIRLSEQVFKLARKVLVVEGLPSGILGMVHGDRGLGSALICHPGICAAAFTGSTQGGLALKALADSRPTPIPFYGELGAINPVVILPEALKKWQAHAQSLAASITQGCGQFCTNPGLLLVPKGSKGDRFIDALAQSLEAVSPHAMLTHGMREAFNIGTEKQLSNGAEPLLKCGRAPLDEPPKPFLSEVDAKTFIATSALHEEVFGPSSLVVRVEGTDDVLETLQSVGGSLTVTILGAKEDSPDNRKLVRTASQIAGRVLFDGVPTGVAVCASQQHGGPWPASTAPMTTSVGDAALVRFLRPVCFQDPPEWFVALDGIPC